MAFPDLSVAVVEKTRRPLKEAAHKVGESSVELGSQYLERLGLRDYLHEHHLIKFGLRFFPGGGDRPIELRTEIGPANEPIVTSYQIDRGRFESDLRQMIVDENGVELIEGATVRNPVLGSGDEDHVVTIETEDGPRTARARWLVDATGRAGMLRGKLKLKRGGRHEANAAWFRVRGRVDIADFAPADSRRWHNVPEGERRWLSTNHLMGTGYWAWIIPLGSGNTSIGVVTHDEHYGFDEIRTLERTQAWLEKHEPVLWAALREREVLDFGCIKSYCHTASRCWHPDRWALVGEAGAFTDPLYSPGTDYIAFANAYTEEMIRADREGRDLVQRSREVNVQYRAFVNGSIDVYRNAAHVYGHARAMATKIYWDNMVYWSYPCQYFLQDIHRLPGDMQDMFGVVGARFVERASHMQKILRFWAEHTTSEPHPEGEFVVMPSFPSILVDAHLALEKRMTPDETLAYMSSQLEVLERLFVELVFRITRELGPTLGAEMWRVVGAEDWDLEISADRLAPEAFSGRKRRQALPHLVRDVERCLGVIESSWSPDDVAAWMKSPKTTAEAS